MNKSNFITSIVISIKIINKEKEELNSKMSRMKMEDANGMMLSLIVLTPVYQHHSVYKYNSIKHRLAYLDESLKIKKNVLKDIKKKNPYVVICEYKKLMKKLNKKYVNGKKKHQNSKYSFANMICNGLETLYNKLNSLINRGYEKLH